MRRRAGLIAVLLAVCGFVPPAFAQGSTADARARILERRVKAAYLSRFTEYIEWPAQSFAASDSPIVIGITGNQEMIEDLLEITRGRSVHGRPITIRALTEDDDVAGVHLIFTEQRTPIDLERLAARSRAASVLSAAETPDALERGIVINFLVVAQRVRFEVSLPAATRSGLKLSSRLLAVAYRVQTQP